MYINTFKYRPEDADCKLCTEYSKKTGCTAKGCPYLAERMETGVVGYGEAVMVVLVYKCGQKKLNNLYYQMKE